MPTWAQDGQHHPFPAPVPRLPARPLPPTDPALRWEVSCLWESARHAHNRYRLCGPVPLLLPDPGFRNGFSGRIEGPVQSQHATGFRVHLGNPFFKIKTPVVARPLHFSDSKTIPRVYETHQATPPPRCVRIPSRPCRGWRNTLARRQTALQSTGCNRFGYLFRLRAHLTGFFGKQEPHHKSGRLRIPESQFFAGTE